MEYFQFMLCILVSGLEKMIKWIKQNKSSWIIFFEVRSNIYKVWGFDLSTL